MPKRQQMILLYGPPASGKDTITQALHERDDRYCLFPRIKYGPGRTATYRMVTAKQLEVIRSKSGEVLWENRRYGATYIVDRSHLAAMLTHSLIPVIHIGQAGAIPPITAALPEVQPLIVALTCPRPIAQARLEARRTGDTHDRLIAYDATDRLTGADLTIDTGIITPGQAAQQIAHLCRAPRHAGVPVPMHHRASGVDTSRTTRTARIL